MIKFLLRRLGQAIPVLIGVSIVVFLTTKLVPGSPVDALLGPSAPPGARARLIASYGLDRSVPEQFILWITHVIQGNLGMSISQQQPVASLVLPALFNTLILTVGAGLLAFAGGLLLGLAAALRPAKWTARIASGFSVLAVSAPQYAVALALLIYLAVYARILPSGGIHTTGVTGLPDLLTHMALPVVAAGLAPMGIMARVFRTEMLSVLQSDFVEALRARGLPRRRIILHAVHNAMPAYFTIGGLQLAFLIGGAVLVEAIFAWPGLGLLVVNAVSSRDLPVLEAGVLLTAVCLVIVNLAVDAGRALIDPRIRR